MSRRLAPYLLLALLGVAFFADLVLHPTHVLYSGKSDLLAMHLPMKRFLVRSWHETGELPLWNPYSFAGMPFVHDVQAALFYPLHGPLLLLPEEDVGAAVSWLVVLHVVVAGWCMYFYAGSQGLGTSARLVAAVGWMFAGKGLLHVLAAGHTIVTPLAWLPLALFFLEEAVRRGSFARATWAGVVYALVVLGTHPQVTFYAGLFLGLWTLAPALEAAGNLGTVRALGRWLACGAWAALVAAALSAVQLWPALESTPEATRSAGVTSAEVLRGVVPALLRLVGPSLTEPRWEFQANFGFLWVAAAGLAPFLRRGRVRFQAFVLVLLLLFSVGGAALVQGLPGFRLFQLPSRMLLLAAFPVALLAGVTTQALLDLPATAAQARRRAARIAIGFFLAGLALAAVPLLLLLGEGGRPQFHPYWPTFLVTAPLFLALLALPAASRLWVGLWLLALTVDAAALVRPYVAVRPEAEVYAVPECVRALAARRAEDESSPWRVLDRGLPNFPSTGPLGVSLPPLGDVALEPVLGYNTFDVRRAKEYLQYVSGLDESVRPRQSVVGYPIVEPMLIENKALLDLLGVRYLLVPDDPARRPVLPKGHAGAGEPGKHPGWKPLDVGCVSTPVYSFLAGGMAEPGPHTVYENTEVFPRAFVVPSAAALPERGVLKALAAADLRKTVFLEGAPSPPEAGTGSFRPARVVERRPNRVAVEVDDGPAGWLVLADVWYPGWVCDVDGRAAPLYRADSLFRAAPLDAGAHRVVFTFAPTSYTRGRLVSGAALAGVFALSLLTALRRVRRSSRET